MICPHCGQHATELLGSARMCGFCHDRAKRELHEDRSVRYCIGCGAGLYRIHPPEHSASGVVQFDCPECGRDHIQYPGEALRRWHEDQPKCPCGFHAAYVGSMVRPGRPSPVDTTVWECTRCGNRLHRSTYAGETQVEVVPVLEREGLE